MYKGKTVWFSSDKGYGFIAYTDDDGNRKEIFVHHTGIQMSGFKTLNKDEDVEFSIEEGQKGPQAAQVRRLGKKNSNEGRDKN